MANLKKELNFYRQPVNELWENDRLLLLIEDHSALIYALYCALKNEIFAKGYYLEIDNATKLKIRKNLCFKNKEIDDYLAALIDAEIFDKDLAQQGILTSVMIQRTYLDCIKQMGREVNRIMISYCLLDNEEINAAQQFVDKRSRKNNYSATERGDSATEYSHSATERGDSATESAHNIREYNKINKKIERESKEREELSSLTLSAALNYFFIFGYKNAEKCAENSVHYWNSVEWKTAGQKIKNKVEFLASREHTKGESFGVVATRITMALGFATEGWKLEDRKIFLDIFGIETFDSYDRIRASEIRDFVKDTHIEVNPNHILVVIRIPRDKVAVMIETIKRIEREYPDFRQSNNIAEFHVTHLRNSGG